ELIEQGMPDEVYRHTGPAIERRLERKYREHERDHLPDHLHAPWTPRPYLRRNEVDDRDARTPGGTRQAQIELREIDQHEHRRAFRPPEPRAQLGVGAIEARALPDRSAATGARLRGDVDHHAHPSRAHPPPPIPKRRQRGSSSRSARQRAAPCRSPDASP